MHILRNTNINIELQNGELVIKTPKYLSKEELQYIIGKAKSSLIEQLKEYQVEKTYIRNEIVQIFGENCKVKINYKNLKKPKLVVEGKNIKICLPNKYKKLNKEEIVIKLVEKLYMLIAEKEIEIIMEKYRILLGIAPEDYVLKRTNNSIAKCSNEKTITINPEIVKFKKEVINYIILHQFCHLRYKTHSKSFYNMLETYMPDYELYEKQLEGVKY